MIGSLEMCHQSTWPVQFTVTELVYFTADTNASGSFMPEVETKEAKAVHHNKQHLHPVPISIPVSVFR